MGRGLVQLDDDARGCVVLANISRTDVKVRANQVVAYAMGVADMEYDIVELPEAKGGMKPSERGGGVKRVSAEHSRTNGVKRVSAEHSRMNGESAGHEYKNPFYSPEEGLEVPVKPCEGREERLAAESVIDESEIPSGIDAEVRSMWGSIPKSVRDVIRNMHIVESLTDLPEHLRAVEMGDKLTSAERKVAWTLLVAYQDVFNRSAVVPTQTSQYKASIDTGTAQPLGSAPYRVSPAERRVIDKALDEMIEAGVVRPSKSPWSSPVVLVPKKDGSIRFCVDYRKLNKVTKIETYPLPRVDEALRAFQGSQCFSVVDMQSGYWQIPLDEQSIPKTAFITHRGLYEYRVLPFGPVNAPGYFQRMMDEVIGGLKWVSVLVYIDDLIVFSANTMTHLHDLKEVFDRLRTVGLTLKPKKCRLLAESVGYLGQIISSKGIAPDPNKVRAVREMPIPCDRNEVRAFLGLAGYYRRFVKGFTKLVAPLQLLVREDIAYRWAEDQQSAFDAVKSALCSEPVLLAHPDFTQPFVLMTDASDAGLGAVLSQTDRESKQERVIEYASRVLTKAEVAWSTTEKEALAVKWACEVMRPYVYGAQFTVITDHRALQWVFQNRTTSARLQRWALQLAEYNFRVEHRPGMCNANADAPSRLPLPAGEGIREDVDSMPELRVTLNALQALPGQPVEAEVSRWTEHTRERRKVILEALQRAGEIKSQNAYGVLPSVEELVAEVKKDTSYGAVYTYLQEGIAPDGEAEKYAREIEPFYCVDGELLLVYIGLKRSRYRDPAGVVVRIVVPKVLRARVIAHHHVHPEQGHMSPKVTYARFNKLFWWPGMWRDTRKLVAACPECQYGDKRRAAPVGELQPIVVDQPWDVVGIDLVGPFKVTPRYNRYILTMIDYYTRWVIFSPLRDAKAVDVVTAVMDQLVHKYGLPKSIVSDRGSQFTGGLFQRLVARLRVGHNMTTPYHPQANGRIERVHRTMNAMLAKQANSHHNDWDEYVGATAFAINTAWSRSTGSTPYELLFGRSPRIPSEVIYGHRIDVTVDKREYGLRLPGVLQEVYKRVQNVHAQYAKRMEEHYNRNRGCAQYAQGDMIKLYMPAFQPNLPQRMQIRWMGPYRVVKQIPPKEVGKSALNYVIDIDGKHVVCNVTRMRKFHECECDSQTAAPPPEDTPTPWDWDPLCAGSEVDGNLQERGPAGSFGDEGLSNGGEEVHGESRANGSDVNGGQDNVAVVESMDVDMGMDVDMNGIMGEREVEVEEAKSSRKKQQWDNVLVGEKPLPVPRNTIIVGQQVIVWVEDEHGVVRWYAGVVYDRPSARRPSIEMQPYNTKDRKLPIEEARFALVWWDARSYKEEWRMVRKPHLQPLIMDVPMANVIMTDVQWRAGRRLPIDALRLLGFIPRSLPVEGGSANTQVSETEARAGKKRGREEDEEA